MRIACSTTSFSEDSLARALTKVAWAGYEAAEIPLLQEPFPEEEALRARLRAEDLEPAAVFAGALPAGVGEAELETLARIGRAAALVRALDGSVVVVEAPAEGDPGGVARALQLLDGALGGLAVDVCVANRTGTRLSSLEDLRRLWECGLPERVGLALDPAEAHLAGWSPADLEQLPEFPRYVYINDAVGGKIVPPGEGEVDLSALGEALRLEGYGGVVCLKLANADPWAVEPVTRAARTLAEGWFGGERP